jgi:hypothetical protein
MYIGTYAGDIQIFDEATEKQVGTASSSRPASALADPVAGPDALLRAELDLREDRDRGHRLAEDAQYLHAQQRQQAQTRISMQPDPLNRFMVLLTRTRHEADRPLGDRPCHAATVRPGERKVTRTIPWPRNEERETVNLRFSRTASSSTSSATRSSSSRPRTSPRWRPGRYAQPIEGGLGRINFGPVHDFYDAPGFFTGLFTMQDPVQKRRIMGIGKVDLTARKIDFRPIGPAEKVSFAQAPDRKRAYGIKSDIGRYEFWTFDLEKASVVEPPGVPGAAPRGAARELERQDHLRLHRGRHHRPVRRGDLQVSADHPAWAPIRRPSSSCVPPCRGLLRTLRAS